MIYLGFGIITGAVLALPAVALSLLCRNCKFFNLAYGDQLGLAAYLVLLFNVSLGLNFFASAVFSIVISAILGVIFYWVVFKPLRRHGPLVLLIASLGLAFVIHNAELAIWGPNPQKYNIPFEAGIRLGPFIITPMQLVLIGLSFVLTGGIFALLRYTGIGRAMRATADNLELATIRGVNTERAFIWTWVICSATAALGGIFLALITTLTPWMGFINLLFLFSALILGGVGNLVGALVGAMIIGLASECAGILPVLAPYKIAIAFVIMFVCLLIRPSGILGKERGF
ncbi:MAG: branched-chain amino acid ABC transporter permease [Deltaproteobacteria bacterium]|nr:branched-chain amino acid ABC transporter permease [Deltaproteobacteria bacterium]